MGRDKATLPWGNPPQPLWQIQLEKLDSLNLAGTLISGRSNQDFGSCEVVLDDQPGAGPLPALAGCMEQASSPYILPLAVDMPSMTTSFLAQILNQSGPQGLVFRSGKFFEPFPALYPRALLPLLRETLAAGQDSMQQFIKQAISRDLLDTAELPPAKALLFKNLNSPNDLPG
jgi:molybdopterin-guanine dinucleotide biosynthesis protein A